MAELRKIFNYDKGNHSAESKVVIMSHKSELYPCSISSTGCLFYQPQRKQILVIKYTDPHWPRLDDLGGRIDLTDQSVREGCVREIMEETNEQIPKSILENLLDSPRCQCFYNPSSKYLSHVVSVDDTFYPDTTIFGQAETHDQISRTLHWMDYSTAKSQLAFRLLCNKPLIQFLDQQMK
jgi:hypothetical protein